MSLARALKPHQMPLMLAFSGAFGAVFYFVLPVEPVWWLGLWVMMAGWGMALAGFRNVGFVILMAAMMFTLAQAHVMRAERAMPWQELASKPHWVSGRLAAVEDGTTPARKLLDIRNATIYGLSHGMKTGVHVRLGVASKTAQDASEGQGIAVRMQIYPPNAPAHPNERDYRLNRFLAHETLYGFVVGSLERTEALFAAPVASSWLETLRNNVKSATTPYAEGVLTSLLVAEQRHIAPELRNAYRQAGLSHLLAVSGLQLTLVGGGIFWLLRWILTLYPPLALNVNGKAIGAVGGLLAAGVYALLAGAPVSVQRALLMVALLLLAAVLGRLRSLPRAWAVALMAVVFVNPAAVMGAGMQLSFAAVAGLIVLGLRYGHPQGWVEKARWLGRSSVVAAWCTAPFLVLQFGQVNVLGVVANLLAVPAMGPITLAAFGGLVMLPLGLHQPFFWLAGQGALWVNAWAVWVAGLPLATVTLPAVWWPVMALAAMLGLWLVLGRVRFGSLLSTMVLLVVGVGAWALQTQTSEDIVLLEGGKTAVLRDGHTLRLVWGKSSRTLEQWVQSGSFMIQLDGACAENTCSVETPLGRVARMPEATVEDCRLNALILTEGPTACDDKTLVPETFTFARWTGSTLDVARPSCNRVWEQASEECWTRK